ncbi:MAG: class I SAM-dependent methyltransferase, partial [Ginsengibacter sp.]
ILLMTLTKSWFEDWFSSPYYHQLYLKRNKKEAADFIDKLIAYLEPTPGAYMLDVACGRGRHSIQLASKGVDVSGIDLSENNVLDAKKSENDHLHFFKHDMRLPFWINYFDYAFNFFTSFGYFDTQRENNNAIRTIAQSLKPNGTLVIDYLNVHYAENHLKPQSSIKINTVDYHITRWHDERFFYKRIVIDDKKSEAFLQYHEKVAKFSLGDFMEMLSFQQMQVQEVFGDYAFSPYNVNTSPRMILIARKRIQNAVKKVNEQ